MTAMFARQEYLDSIERHFGKDCIIVLTGQRRVGKSCTLKILRDTKRQDLNANVIYIDKEKHKFDFIQSYRDLNAYIEQHYKKGKTNYILLDEIQDVAEFERTVRSFRTEPDAEIVVTGSNARMLSSELSTLIGGRYKEIHIHPLSYREFLLFHDLSDCDDALAKYIQYGGLPGLVKVGLDRDDALEYQSDIFHTAILKDVIMRNKIRNVPFLTNFANFMADSVGKIISSNSIAKYMKSQGESITSATVDDYARFLSEAFIVSKVNRYDIRGKRLFENCAKFYFEDHGIRNALVGGTREGDIEKVIENIIYQHLVRLGYTVNVGQLKAGEIDFVCTKPDAQRIYVQAAYLVADDETRKREFGNLHAINDNYPKYVVSMTPLVTCMDNEGVLHLHLRRFLMADSIATSGISV